MGLTPNGERRRRGEPAAHVRKVCGSPAVGWESPCRPPDHGELADLLNPVQREAVVHDEVRLLVIAGAGSGKTGCSPTASPTSSARASRRSSILAITFTNKAAQEMRERVGALVGPVAQKMWVWTFHSACVRILRRDADKLGYPELHDLRPGGRRAAHRLRHPRPEPRHEAVPAPQRARPISAAKNDTSAWTRTPSGRT